MRERGKSYFEGRRRLLKALLAGGLLAIIPSSTPSLEGKLDQEVDGELRRLAPNAKFVTVDGGYYWPHPIQLVKLDHKSQAVRGLVNESRYLVGHQGSQDVAVSQLNGQVIKFTKWNGKQRLGYQTLEEEMDIGGVCLGKAVLLYVLIEKLVPGAQPRIVEMIVKTNDRRKSLVDYIFEHHVVVGFYSERSEVKFADPTETRDLLSYSELASLNDGIEIRKIVKLDLK